MFATCAQATVRTSSRPAPRTCAYLAACAAIALLGVGCGGASTDPGAPPRILAFIANPTSVIQGRTTRFAWETEGATAIELVDETGARVDVPADRLSGNVESPPLESTRDFVLTARSSGGVATARLTVTVLLDPTEVAITRFEVAPQTIAPGGSATLRWETANARAVTLAEVDGETLEPTAALRGERAVTDVRTTRSYVLTADGPRGPKSQTVTLLVEGTPVVDSFTADDAQVEPGASTTLRWVVRGAPDGTTVTVLGLDDAIVARAQPTTGSVAVSPILNTRYVLRIDTPLGQSVRSAPLLVAVGGFPRVLRFDVSPDTIPFGDAATITWRVENAVGVSVRSPTAELVTSPLGEGTVTVTATRTTTFTLLATNPRGDTTREATLTVEPAAPRIPRFVADPPIVALGARTTLRWTVVGGLEQTLRTAAGAPIVRTPDAEGAIEVAVTSTRTTYTLEARNPSGTVRAIVEVLGTGRAEITQLEPTPAFFTGSSTTVDVYFATRSATAARLDVGPRRAALAAGVTGGTYTFTATASARVVLVASGPGGVARREAWTRRARLVAEQGDTSTSAVTLVGPDAAAIGALVGADVDWYAIDVPRGGSVRAFTTDALGGCAVDTTLELYAPDGRLLGFDDDDGPGPCSELEPARDAFAAGLAAGRHLLAVRGFGPALRGGYVLVVELGTPGCGNGLVEAPSGEQCDDSNRAAGDGCDASCRVEPIGRVQGPGANGRFTTSTSVGRLEQLVELVLTAPGYVEAETFVPTPGRCDPSGASRDTVLTLYDANLTVLGRDDDGGLATCSRIDPARARWAALPAGRYLLGVREAGDDEPLAQVAIDVRLLGVGCGNGVVESGEQCDDGNIVGGDGCTAACRLDGVAELEPNDTVATAPRLGGPGVDRVQLVGALDPARDVDVVRVDVPAGYHLDATATLAGGRCRDDARLELRLLDGAGVELARDDDAGPDGACGRLWPYSAAATRAMAAGTYAIAVALSPAATTATAGPYLLDVRLLPAPRCGNGVVDGAEACDDGNVVGGDGCSAQCALEPRATITLPSATPTRLTGAIVPSPRRDAYALVVTGTSAVLRAETVVDVATRSCFEADTVLTVLDAQGRVLGTDDDDGVDACAAIDASRDPFALLAPGTYTLVVEARGGARAIPSYTLDVVGPRAGQCGNGVREGREACDGEPYCDAQCALVVTASLVGPPAQLARLESIVPVGDRDVFAVETTTTAYLTVDTGAPLVGQCVGADTAVRVLERATLREVAFVDDAASACAVIDAGRVRLDAGRYLVTVEERGDDAPISSYEIRLGLVPALRCGNAVVEPGEQCDDGNSASGDGCSGACVAEPDGLYLGPGSAQTFFGELRPIGDVDTYQLELTQPSIVVVELGSPSIGACGGAARVSLLDVTGRELGAAEGSGPGSCVLLSGVTATFARVPAGTYVVRVEELGNDAVLTPYVLRIDARRQNVCGNGVTDAGEQCDDGNTLSGDGCSSMCAREVRQVIEVENNSLPAQAQDVGVVPVGAAVEVVGALADPMDRDFLRFTLTARAAVLVGTYESLGGWLTRCPSIDTELWLYSGQPAVIDEIDPAFEPTILGYDDEDGPGSCSLLNGSNTAPQRITLNAGTYWLQVRPWFNTQAITQYYLRIDAQ